MLKHFFVDQGAAHKDASTIGDQLTLYRLICTGKIACHLDLCLFVSLASSCVCACASLISRQQLKPCQSRSVQPISIHFKPK